MSVSDKFRIVFAELLKARHPLLLVETHEDDRAADEIAAVATDPDLRTRRSGLRVVSDSWPGQARCGRPRRDEGAGCRASTSTRPR